ncbi:hypothetical protein [Actinokineospora sp.]|uniref:hypothetical protein n=1 Tax=Actinokineospora sp. TaxID=1872133 RepID=UPI0040378962
MSDDTETWSWVDDESRRWLDAYGPHWPEEVGRALSERVSGWSERSDADRLTELHLLIAEWTRSAHLTWLDQSTRDQLAAHWPSFEADLPVHLDARLAGWRDEPVDRKFHLLDQVIGELWPARAVGVDWVEPGYARYLDGWWATWRTEVPAHLDHGHPGWRTDDPAERNVKLRALVAGWQQTEAPMRAAVSDELVEAARNALSTRIPDLARRTGVAEGDLLAAFDDLSADEIWSALHGDQAALSERANR